MLQPPSHTPLNSSLSIDLNALLGKGSTGNVYLGLQLSPLIRPVAIKAIPLSQVTNEVTAYLLHCELEALKIAKLQNSQNIVKLQQIVVQNNHCYIAMQLLEAGTLKQLIQQSKGIEQNKILHIFGQILHGYSFLAKHGIIHRDLKPDNILMQATNEHILNAKIIDFGYCIVPGVEGVPKMYYNVGSPKYMAPEAYTQNNYSEKSDVWALGVILYEMLKGETPDSGIEMKQYFQKIKEKGSIQLEKRFTGIHRELLQKMLVINPERRANSKQILEILERRHQNPQQRRNNTIERIQNLVENQQNNRANFNHTSLQNSPRKGINFNFVTPQQNSMNNQIPLTKSAILHRNTVNFISSGNDGFGVPLRGSLGSPFTQNQNQNQNQNQQLQVEEDRKKMFRSIDLARSVDVNANKNFRSIMNVDNNSKINKNAFQNANRNINFNTNTNIRSKSPSHIPHLQNQNNFNQKPKINFNFKSIINQAQAFPLTITTPSPRQQNLLVHPLPPSLQTTHKKQLNFTYRNLNPNNPNTNTNTNTNIHQNVNVVNQGMTPSRNFLPQQHQTQQIIGQPVFRQIRQPIRPNLKVITVSTPMNNFNHNHNFSQILSPFQVMNSGRIHL